MKQDNSTQLQFTWRNYTRSQYLAKPTPPTYMLLHHDTCMYFQTLSSNSIPTFTNYFILLLKKQLYVSMIFNVYLYLERHVHKNVPSDGWMFVWIENHSRVLQIRCQVWFHMGYVYSGFCLCELGRCDDKNLMSTH